MTAVAIVMLIVAVVLIYSAVKGQNPIEVAKSIASTGRPR